MTVSQAGLVIGGLNVAYGPHFENTAAAQLGGLCLGLVLAHWLRRRLTGKR